MTTSQTRAFIACGDLEAVIGSLPAQSFDGVLCDPPYELGFMGKAWDSSGVAFRSQVWHNVRHLMKPGAHLLAFGGTRTFHRLTCAIEDGGLRIRDCLSWLYGSGMPKSLDIGRAVDEAVGADRPRDRRPDARSAIMGDRPWLEDPEHRFPSREPASEDGHRWNGYGTNLKPCWEPCILAMRDTEGTFAENALAHGVSGLSIDQCRIGDRPRDKQRSNGVLISQNASMGGGNYGREVVGTVNGGWPGNVILDEATAAVLDETVGSRKSGARKAGNHELIGYSGCGVRPMPALVGSEGGPSRYFYCAKARQDEKHAGCDDLFWQRAGASLVPISRAKFDALQPKDRAEGNAHPTVKPTGLCEYLARLILPPVRTDGEPRRLLVPFSGSGSEVIGALRAGWDEVYGIELDPAHVLIAERRITHAGFGVEAGDA